MKARKYWISAVLTTIVFVSAGCDSNDKEAEQSEKTYYEYTIGDVEDMSEAELLVAIEELGYGDSFVTIFADRLKEISPETNKKLGDAFKRDYTFDWYADKMLKLKTSEQTFIALKMAGSADKASQKAETLERAWAHSDLYLILDTSFYAEGLEISLSNVKKYLPEDQRQQLKIDTGPVKALAKKLLEQGDPNNQRKQP
jgi:hypothetical protein